jgi:hypothetical protein
MGVALLFQYAAAGGNIRQKGAGNRARGMRGMRAVRCGEGLTGGKGRRE